MSHVASGSVFTRRRKLCSIRPDNDSFPGRPKPPASSAGDPSARQLEQGQRVPLGFGQDLLPDLLVEPPAHDQLQQRPGVAVAESLDDQFGDPVEVLDRLAGGEGQQHALGLDPAGGEGERLRGGPVQPLAVVDHADQRPSLGRLRQQARDGQADQEAIRGRPLDQAERRPQRIGLRRGQAPEVIEHRLAQLLEARVGQLHLRLDAGRTHHPQVDRGSEHVVEQGGLAHPGLAAHHDRATAAGADLAEQAVEERAFAFAPRQHKALRGSHEGC